MFSYRILIFGFSLAMFLSCSGPDYVTEAQKAMQNENYSEAIKHWEKAREQENYDFTNDEQIALAYMLKGQELYKNTKNVRSFVGNFERGQSYIPEQTSKEFKNQYSKILFTIGKAYNEAKPKNETETEDFFSNAINSLKESLLQDSLNGESQSLLNEIKLNKFQGLIDKGKEAYHKGVKTGNVNLYFTAEYFLKQAMKFDSANEEIYKYLKKIESKTISILNYRDGLAIAILKYEYQKDDLVMYIAIRNYLQEKIDIKLSEFKLADKNGNIYGVYSKGMKVQELFGGNAIQDTVLAVNQGEIDGVLVFNVPEKPQISYLSYQTKNKEYRKYLP